MKHNIESSLKRFLKRKVKITMGFVVAFLITGTVGFAQNDYYVNSSKGNVVVENGGIINATAKEDTGNSRYTALGSTAGKTLNITADKIDIKNSDTISNPQRLYGISNDSTSVTTGTITAPEINITLTGTGNTEIRGIRNLEKSDFTINGNITENLITTGGNTVGIDIWDSTADLKINGDTTITAKSTSGQSLGIQAGTGGKTTLTGNTILNIENTNNILNGILSNGGEINLKGKTTITTKNTSGNSLGIQSLNNGKITLTGDTSITMTNDSSGALTGVVVGNNAGELVLNGNTIVDIKGNSGSIIGINNVNDGGKITFKDSLNMTVSNGSTKNSANDWYYGLRANKSTTTFGGNTNITITDNTNISDSISFIADVLSDKGNSISTVVNFDGAKNILTLNSVGTGKNTLYGVRVSGEKATANFTGADTTINITTNSAKQITALESQYSGNIVSNTGTKLTLNVTNNNTDSNSSASGITTLLYNAYNGNVNLNGSVDINSTTNAGTAYGILNTASDTAQDAKDGKVVIGEKLNISATSKIGQAVGVLTTGKYGETTLNGDTNINVNGNSGAFGISAKNGGTVSATGKNISIAATSTGGNATAVEANNGTGTGGEVVKLGGENTENIVLKANGKNFATGIEVVNYNPKDGQKIAGSKVEVNSKNLIIDVHSSDSEAAGIWVQNSTLEEGSTDKIANVVVNSENTVINVTSDTKGNALGLVAMSQGKLEVNGNLEVNAETAILTRGNAVTTINKNKDKTVKLNGDIEFNYDKPTSGTPVDATVDLNLSNAESFFKGKIVVTGEGIPENYEKVSNMNLGLSNKATWENTGDSFVSNLDLNNGIINNTSVENDISVGTLKGNGGDINLVAEIEANGTATSGKLAIDKVDNKDAKFNVNYSGEGNLEVSQEEAKDIFDDLAGKITVENGQFNANAKIEEGLISGEHTAEFVKGQGNEVVVKPNTVTTGSNSMVEGMRDLATINVLSWRQEMSSLNERMGELRNSTGSNGVWARVYGGKVENGSKYDNEYQTYQVGYDKKYPVENGDLFVGALVSYTDGKTDYNLGDGENYSVGAGIYATWLNRDGQFADVVLKQSRLHNKFDVRSKNGNLSQHGDYSNWGTSLSGQYGRRFDLDDKFFVEPSVQLTFGRVSSEDYTTSAGVKVEQDTAYTLVGDVGTAVGYKFSDKGNVYARASLVKEFKGDIDTKYSYGGKSEYTSEDLSDTWGEFGVGVNYRIRENVNMYVDIQRTEEATVENKWQANLGFRWEF